MPAPRSLSPIPLCHMHYRMARGTRLVSDGGPYRGQSSPGSSSLPSYIMNEPCAGSCGQGKMDRKTCDGLRLSVFLEPPEWPKPSWGTGPQCVPKDLPSTQPLLRWSSSPEGLVGGIGMGQGKASHVVYPPSTVPNKWWGGSDPKLSPCLSGPSTPPTGRVCCGQGAVAVWMPAWRGWHGPHSFLESPVSHPRPPAQPFSCLPSRCRQPAALLSAGTPWQSPGRAQPVPGILPHPRQAGGGGGTVPLPGRSPPLTLPAPLTATS